MQCWRHWNTMQYHSLTGNGYFCWFSVGHLSVTGLDPLCSCIPLCFCTCDPLGQACLAPFSWSWIFQFFRFWFKHCSYSFLKTSLLVKLFHPFSILSWLFSYRFSRSLFWPYVIIVWVKYQSANSGRSVLCRFLTEPAFTAMRLQIMYVKRRHHTHCNKIIIDKDFRSSLFFDTLFSVDTFIWIE